VPNAPDAPNRNDFLARLSADLAVDPLDDAAAPEKSRDPSITTTTPEEHHAPPPWRERKLTAIAAAFGYPHASRSSLTKYRRKPWFPKPDAAGNWDVRAVARAILQNMPHGRIPDDRIAKMETIAFGTHAPKPTPNAAANPNNAASPASTDARDFTIDTDDPLLQTLRGADDPVAIARAAATLAGRRLAHDLATGTGNPRRIPELTNALKELRNAEADYLTIRRRAGELIERDSAKTVIGDLVQRLINLLAALEAELPTWVEIQLADPTFHNLAPDERRRKVRNWFHERTRAIRATECVEINGMLYQEESNQ
jgi:hypothetical protein